MPKRFTDTEKWTKNKWFRSLIPEYKLFWLYLLDNCDGVGVWEEDVELASYIIGYQYSIDTLLTVFKDRIHLFKENRKWWIKDFINFQYGILDEKNLYNKPHQSYIKILKNHTLWIEYRKTIHSLKEKEKDKEKDKDESNNIDNGISDIFKSEFEAARKIYPGTKRGLDTEYDNFKKKYKDYKALVTLLRPAIEKEMNFHRECNDCGKFVPEYKHFKTWINQRCWEQEYYCSDDKPYDSYSVPELESIISEMKSKEETQEIRREMLAITKVIMEKQKNGY